LYIFIKTIIVKGITVQVYLYQLLLIVFKSTLLVDKKKKGILVFVKQIQVPYQSKK
jgi:hypothetical protein